MQIDVLLKRIAHTPKVNTSSQSPRTPKESKRKSRLKWLGQDLRRCSGGRKKDGDRLETAKASASQAILSSQEDVEAESGVNEHCVDQHRVTYGEKDTKEMVEVVVVNENDLEITTTPKEASPRCPHAPDDGPGILNLPLQSADKPAAAHFIQTNCVFRVRDTKLAKHFAERMMASTSLSSSTSSSSNMRVYWADASHRKGKADVHHGGIAVARRQGTHWTVQSAYVTGLARSGVLEQLAVLTALKEALRDTATAPGGSVVIFSDSNETLAWLEKALTLCAAIQAAAGELQATGDHAHTLVSFTKAYGYLKVDRYHTVRGCVKDTIGLRILAAYSTLVRRGLAVAFHWVPAHAGIEGNEVADVWASHASLWFMCAAPRPKAGSTDEVLVMPLGMVEFDEPWRRGCQRLSIRPTADHARQILQDLKPLRYALTVDPATEDAMEKTAATMIQDGGKANAKQPKPRATPKKKAEAVGASQTPVIGPPKATKNPRQGGGRGQTPLSRPICTHCKRKGHVEEQCHRRNPELKPPGKKAGQALAAVPPRVLMVPSPIMFVSYLHPSLVDRPCLGARHMRIGLARMSQYLVR